MPHVLARIIPDDSLSPTHPSLPDTHTMGEGEGGGARRARVRGPKFEVFGTSNPELRIVSLARPASLARLAQLKREGAAAPGLAKPGLPWR